MAEIMVIKKLSGRIANVLAEPNLVVVKGTVKDSTDTLAERTVHLYKSGTSELIESTTSNSSDGKFEMRFHGEPSTKVRLLAFAKKGESDERSKAFDFVNPAQHTVLI